MPVGLITPIVLLAPPPVRRVSELAEEERLKVGAGMVRAMFAVFFVVPEAPETVTVYVPGTEVLLAVKIRAAGPPATVKGQLKFAVTPAGAPDTERPMVLLLRAVGLRTLTVLIALLPPARIVRALGDGERPKLGFGIVSAIVVELARVPEVPFTTTT